jgi:hypothetical protein
MTPRCDRFEAEALLRLERGEPLDEHFATCPDCREAQAVYERLRQEIGEMDMEEPSPGWEARVWQRIGERRRRPRWAWVLAPIGAAALAATLFFALPRTPSTPSLAQEIVGGETVVRAASAHPGDRLELRVETAGAPYAELRVYRNERELLLRCPGGSSCERDGSEIRASLIFPSAGEYQAVLVLDDEPLAAPGKGLDSDAGAALDRGARIILGDRIAVR